MCSVINMENSAGDFKREVTLPASAEKSVKDEKENELSENVFQHFHDKYLKLKSLASNNCESNSGTNQESKILLESIIEELSQSIKDNYENHESFLRLLGMKIFLQHILSKVLSENESLNLLEKVYEESKPYLANPEVIYSGFLIINSLSALKGKQDNSSDKVKDILEECQIVYKQLKQTNKDDNYYSGNELFSPEKKLSSNRDAKLKYEKLVVTNLLFLGSIYEKLGDHYKDTVCYHTAFNRMLNKGLVSPFKWVDFTTRLACVFIDDNNFKDARHHLSAATHVHEMLEVRNSSLNDSSKNEIIKSNSVHLALAWVRYCVLLFEKSKDEDRRKFSSLFKNGYLFPNSRPIEKSIMYEKYKGHFLNDKNIAFQNPRSMETIDKEIDEDSSEDDKTDKKNKIDFCDILDIVKSHMNETQNNKDESQMNPEETLNNDEKHDKNSENLENTEEHASITNEAGDNLESKLIPDVTNENTMMKKCENNETDIKTENTDKDLQKNNKDDVEKNNKDDVEKNNKDDVEKNNRNDKELTFSSLGCLPIEQSVTKDLIQTPEQAKKLFTFAYRWSKQAQQFYPKTSDFYSYAQVILNLVSLHRLCAYFQGRDNLEYRISLEQTRESLLEHLVTELSEIQPENHLHVRLYQEMALLNIDLAMLNMCNIYNINADDTYKLFALAEIQSHINHIYIVGDMLERSTNIFERKKQKETSSVQKTDSENASTS